MRVDRQIMLAAGLIVAGFTSSIAATASAEIRVKIGVLTDLSGVYSASSGQGSVEAARLAVEDFLTQNSGAQVDLISADHLNKPDLGSAIAQQWFDVEGVDAVADLPTSSVALAVAQVAARMNKVALLSGGVGEALTTKYCEPTTVQWTIDTYAFAHGTARGIGEGNAVSWFYLAGDFGAAKALVAEHSADVTALGGKVVGTVYSPLDTADFSSFLLQAQSSGADMIGLSITGGDLIRAVTQAAEFGITAGGQRMVPLIAMIDNIHSIGPDAAQGMRLLTAFDVNANDATRDFARRFAARRDGVYPNAIQAGVYSAVLQYLKAVKSVGAAGDGAKVVEEMKRAPIRDPLFGEVTVRPNGRAIHDLYIVDVKKKSEMAHPWDHFKVVSVLPGEEAARPLGETGCKLIK